MKKYKLTLIGLVISAVVLLGALSFDVDLFEIIVSVLMEFDKFEVDEFILPISILGIFTFFDLIRRQREHRVEIEKNKIYKAMMYSNHHILNNFLNQVQLFKMTAEETPGFDPEVLSLYDQTIKDASSQIEALGSIISIDEESIHASIAPQSVIQAETQSLN